MTSQTIRDNRREEDRERQQEELETPEPRVEVKEVKPDKRGDVRPKE